MPVVLYGNRLVYYHKSICGDFDLLVLNEAKQKSRMQPLPKFHLLKESSTGDSALVLASSSCFDVDK